MKYCSNKRVIVSRDWIVIILIYTVLALLFSNLYLAFQLYERNGNINRLEHAPKTYQLVPYDASTA